MSAPQRVKAWIAQNYRKPAIDQEWLADCAEWIASEFGLDPDNHFDQFVQHVEQQLLQSNLADSTVPGSGIDPLLVASNPPSRPSTSRPGRQTPREKKTTGPVPILVEVTSITEIAHSAFSLLNTHQTRIDRADLGLAQEENAEQQRDEDEGPVPRFPRGMLRFELSDGSTSFRAIEFRSLPQLELGTTPLGYKMFLKSTPVRNGIVFLEPGNVTLKGYRTEDHDVNREQIFLSSLRKRLGRPDPPPEPPAVVQQQANLPPQPVAPHFAHQHQPQPMAKPPSPSADSDDMFGVDPDVLREMDMQIDLEVRNNQRPGIRAPPPARPPPASKEKHATASNHEQTLPKSLNATIPSSTLKASSNATARTSSYFADLPPKTHPVPDIGLSPRPSDFDIAWGSDEPGSSTVSVTKLDSTSARPPSTAPLKPPVRRLPSPDPYDDIFDMDVDDLDLEHLDRIEQRALGSDADATGKSKRKASGTKGPSPSSRPSMMSAKQMPSGSLLGTTPSTLFRTEPGTRAHSSTQRVTNASSLSGSTESPMPPSTQPSARGHRLLRDPSLILIPSSSEDEVPGDHGRPLDVARRRAKKPRQEVESPDVIDISD